MPTNRAISPLTTLTHVSELSRNELEQLLLQTQQSLQQQRQAAATTHAEQEQFFSIINAMLQTSNDGIIVMNSSDTSILFNQLAAEYLDVSDSFIANTNSSGLLKQLLSQAKKAGKLECQFIATQEKKSTRSHETLELHNGTILEVRYHVHKSDKRTIGRVWHFHDITQLRKNESEIQHRAFHDPLTELPNRHLFSDRILTALSRQQRSDNLLALLFIDLDGFKYINDSLGHEVGDSILQGVAKRLHGAVRDQDTIARHGGDEFLVLLENVTDQTQLCKVADRILQALSRPFITSTQEICMSASIGISLAPQDGVEPDFLIRNADLAMYKAKDAGRNNYQFFHTDMVQDSSRIMLLQSQISLALQKKEFRLFYQPKICLATGRIKGAEALIRWQKKCGEMVAPAEFIEVAEQCGLIIPISEWVLETACAQLQQWQSITDDDFVLSINLSSIHFRQENIVSDIISCLKKFDISAHNFELELTESIVINNPEKSISTLNELRDAGIQLSIDDFGTGYSSFNYLKELPITAIKIDKSFIENIDVFSRDLALVKSIIDIAHTLELEVVAEGIETEKMQELLLQSNCDTAQGYLYSRPVPPEAFIPLLNQTFPPNTA